MAPPKQTAGGLTIIGGRDQDSAHDIDEAAASVPPPPPVALDAHMQTRGTKRGLFIPEEECELLARSLASLAGYADSTGAFPRLRSAFQALAKTMDREKLEDEALPAPATCEAGCGPVVVRG